VRVLELADPKPEESFKVVDRRLFTEDGQLRKEALEQERREEESSAAVRKRAAPLRGSSAASAQPSGTAPSPSPDRAVGEAPAPSRSFQMLVDFLARNAAVLLGGYPDPRTGQAILDLEGARELIDMLDVLREKTRGNLAPDDDHLLLDLLGSLKLSYLEMSKAAAQAVQEKAKAKS
jgi:Domain of unknown function (DUF1844)